MGSVKLRTFLRVILAGYVILIINLFRDFMGLYTRFDLIVVFVIWSGIGVILVRPFDLESGEK